MEDAPIDVGDEGIANLIGTNVEVADDGIWDLSCEAVEDDGCEGIEETEDYQILAQGVAQVKVLA